MVVDGEAEEDVDGGEAGDGGGGLHADGEARVDSWIRGFACPSICAANEGFIRVLLEAGVGEHLVQMDSLPGLASPAIRALRQTRRTRHGPPRA